MAFRSSADIASFPGLHCQLIVWPLLMSPEPYREIRGKKIRIAFFCIWFFTYKLLSWKSSHNIVPVQNMLKMLWRFFFKEIALIRGRWRNTALCQYSLLVCYCTTNNTGFNKYFYLLDVLCHQIFQLHQDFLGDQDDQGPQVNQENHFHHAHPREKIIRMMCEFSASQC